VRGGPPPPPPCRHSLSLPPPPLSLVPSTALSRPLPSLSFLVQLSRALACERETERELFPPSLRALYLPTFTQLLIVNKSLSLARARALSLSSPR